VIQVALFLEACACGRPVWKSGMCKSCYARNLRNRHRFGGHREEVIERDGRQCRVCGGDRLLVVHHRIQSQEPEYLVTLCAGCHARVHRLLYLRYWVPELMAELWEEQHPGRPLQLQISSF
jgi:hypothetical protein